MITDTKPKSETRKRSQSRRVKCRFGLEQRQFDKPTGLSCQPYMNMIAQYFEVSLLTSTHHSIRLSCPAKSYYFSVETPQKLSRVIAYFEMNPLKGIKALDYRDFLTVYYMILNKEHLTDSGTQIIKQIVAGMNSNRMNAHTSG